MAPPRSRYSLAAIILHWMIAALICANFVLAWRFDAVTGMAQFALYQWHKSLGISVLALSVLRLVLRLFVRPPPPMGAAAWERGLARAVHWAFYGLMIGIPLTGWLVVSTSPIRLPTLLYGVVPWPHLPVADAGRAAWLAFAETAHRSLAYAMAALIVLHVLAALKHQFMDRDGTLLRMTPIPFRSR